ncbi:hypothetical protein niasHT_008433 [Heterodera trifolii]|uniref:Effector protein n=1 Tax=Heterodera trifolii TaxID=157864 RepID=A0ABD2M6K4_9BILA
MHFSIIFFFLLNFNSVQPCGWLKNGPPTVIQRSIWTNSASYNDVNATMIEQHFGINCVELELPMDISQFSVNVSASLFDLSCAEFLKNGISTNCQTIIFKSQSVGNSKHVKWFQQC